MGTPEYAAVSLARLLDGPHRVLAVVTRPDKPRGRGQQVEPSPTRRLADEAGIPVMAPASARDPAFLEALGALGADLGVVVAYGRILPRAALDAPRLGCINAHASLLPLLRGAAPIERAILAGHDRTGVTIMQMNEGLDEGDMLLARSLEIGAETTGDELRRRLADLSAALLAEAVDLFAMADAAPGGVEGSGLVVRTPQDHAAATFAPPLRKEEAAITWDSPARDLVLRVRAFAPRPGAFCFDGPTRLKVLAARALDDDAGAAPGTVLGAGATGLRVACGRGVLEVATLQPEGRRAMAATDYERGRAAGTRVLRDGR